MFGRVILLDGSVEVRKEDGMMMCGDGMSFSDEASDDYLETKPVVEARYQPPEWCRVCGVQVPANGGRHRVEVAARRLDEPVHATWCEVCEVQVVRGNWRMYEGGQRHRQLVEEARHMKPLHPCPQPYWCEVWQVQVGSSWREHEEGRRHGLVVGEEQESRGQGLVEEAPLRSIKVSPPVTLEEDEGDEEVSFYQEVRRWSDDGGDYGRKRRPSDQGRRGERVKVALPSVQQRRVKEHTSHRVRRGEGVKEEGEYRRGFTNWREQQLQEEFMLDLNELMRMITSAKSAKKEKSELKSAKKEKSGSEGKPGRRKIV